jgi:hypothetical protein
MNTTKSNKQKIVRSRTVKSRVPSRNNAIKKIYNRDYYGKKILPTTNIIQYIDSNFNVYMSMKAQKEKQDLPSASFEDFFIVDDILKKKEKSADINIQINKRPNTSLDKLLAYSLYYSEYKNWFNSPNKKMDTSLFKYQVGKDLSRIDFKINNIKYNANDEDNNSLKADKFNVEIINILSKFSVINFDLINKIDIVMCQNILNFITDLISLMISIKIAPEKLIITKAEKNATITLTKLEQNIAFNFKTKFYITKDGGINDPEFTCGDMEFIFVIDFKRKTYKLEKFNCKYNADICYQTESLQPNVENNQNKNEKEKDNSKYFRYGIPIALGVGGIVSAPFLLAALGGKNKRYKRSKRHKGKTRNKK